MVKTNSSTSNSSFPGLVKLIIKIFLFMPILLLIIGINYFGDAGNIYAGEKVYNCYANAISEGKNVSGFSNLDERLVKSRIIEKLQYVPDVVILGSSRSMMLGNQIFTNKKVFNSSVSGAVLQDYLALAYKWEEKEFYPKYIVLGLDPWLFNDNVVENRWESVSEDYKKMSKVLGYESSTEIQLLPQKALNIVSLSYMSKSLDQLWKNRKKKKKIETRCVPTYKTQDEDYAMILKDGRHVYDKKYRSKSVAEVETEAISYANQKPVYHMEGFSEISSKNLELLIRFVKYLKMKNVKLMFYLDPYHPETYGRLMKNPSTSIIGNVENVIKDIGAKENIPIFGSYNPQILSLTKDHFYDGMHTKPEGDAKVIEQDTEKFTEYLR